MLRNVYRPAESVVADALLPTTASSCTGDLNRCTGQRSAGNAVEDNAAQRPSPGARFLRPSNRRCETRRQRLRSMCLKLALSPGSRSSAVASRSHDSRSTTSTRSAPRRTCRSSALELPVERRPHADTPRSPAMSVGWIELVDVLIDRATDVCRRCAPDPGRPSSGNHSGLRCACSSVGSNRIMPHPDMLGGRSTMFGQHGRFPQFEVFGRDEVPVIDASLSVSHAPVEAAEVERDERQLDRSRAVRPAPSRPRATGCERRSAGRESKLHVFRLEADPPDEQREAARTRDQEARTVPSRRTHIAARR